MADETQAVSTTSAEVVPEPSTVPSERPAPAKPGWWTDLETADPKELAKHPIVAGLAGTMHERKMANAVARALVERDAQYAQKDAERAAEAERQRLASLPDYEYRQEVHQKEQADATARMQADKQLMDLRQTAMEIIDELGLDESDIAPLSGKQMGATPLEGFKLYVKELNAIALAKGAKSAVEKEMTNWQKSIEDAARAKALAEINGSEPSPDVGGGKAPAAPRGAKALSDQKTYESLGKTPLERYRAVVGSRP